MKKRNKTFVVVALGAGIAWAQIAGAQSKPQGGPSMTDSPYKNGAPPITGGYTDTSQGGTKGSGDPRALPPNVAGQGAAQSGQQQPKTAAPAKPDQAKSAMTILREAQGERNP